MKRYHMSLRTTVVLSLSLLMAAAMLLIGVVMLKVSQRDLLRAKVEQGLLLKASAEHLLTAVLSSRGGSFEKLHESPLLDDFLAKTFGPTGEWTVTITDRKGLVVYASEAKWSRSPQRIPDLERVARLGLENISFTPSSRLFWWALPDRVSLHAPLFREGKVLGAISLEASLADVRESLWGSQKLILLYIGLDLLVLVAFGTYLFSKLVVRPVQELVQTAERFQEGDRLPELSAGEENELSKLAQALNEMLQRLDENKEELREHISSLEQANLELQQAQQEVIFGEKLASVGRLAAGIAHEIGNPIGILLGYLELVQREDLGEAERRELIARMGSEVQRIHQIIRQLLDLTRPSSSERVLTSINGLIQETLSVIEHQLRQQGVEITYDLAARPDTVLANGDQLKQVFLNLAVNAGDAMAATSERAQGGQLRVGTRIPAGEDLTVSIEGRPLRRRTDPPTADYRHARRARVRPTVHWIEVSFADTGVGIAREDLDRVFDPFFTTKEPGKGTGLGLSVSVQIIEAMGGRMEVSSRLGEGTTVTLLLPLCDEHVEQRIESETR